MARRKTKRKSRNLRVFKHPKVIKLTRKNKPSLWTRKPNTRESVIESRCMEIAHAHGCLLLKWVSPGTKGVPDRLLIGPKFVVFIEFKTETGSVSVHQHGVLTALANLGHATHVIRSVTEFTLLLNHSLQYTGNGIKQTP